jgi:hypothetical protein
MVSVAYFSEVREAEPTVPATSWPSIVPETSATRISRCLNRPAFLIHSSPLAFIWELK